MTTSARSRAGSARSRGSPSCRGAGRTRGRDGAVGRRRDRAARCRQRQGAGRRQESRKGFLVDFAGNLTRSAQDGLPIYRITGGAGFDLGRKLRSARARHAAHHRGGCFEARAPPPAEAPPPKPVADSPAPEFADPDASRDGGRGARSGTGRVRTEIVDPKAQQTGTPEKAAPHVAATEPPAPANAPQPIVELAQGGGNGRRARRTR